MWAVLNRLHAANLLRAICASHKYCGICPDLAQYGLPNVDPDKQSKDITNFYGLG